MSPMSTISTIITIHRQQVFELRISRVSIVSTIIMSALALSCYSHAVSA